MTISIDRVQSVMRGFRKQRILVVGDVMLDRYIQGSVSRISPEAPVPVVHVTKERHVPGGASNVASNVRSLAGQAAVSSVIGRDPSGRELKKLLQKNKVEVKGLLELPHFRTIVKTRILADRQQVVRVDWEHPYLLAGSDAKRLCALLRKEVAKATGVILEDYGKGVMQQAVVDVVLREARRKGIPVGLDPKDNEDLRLAGITLATPNRKEAFIAAGRDETAPLAEPLKDAPLLEVGRILMRKWQPALLAITLGPHGMLLLEKGQPPRHVPTRAREVFDVSGAGDTVIATCVLALAAGASHVEAAEIANYAAGVVVGKLGTATCTQEELVTYMAAGKAQRS